jgi:hypothetical protein
MLTFQFLQDFKLVWLGQWRIRDDEDKEECSTYIHTYNLMYRYIPTFTIVRRRKGKLEYNTNQRALCKLR